MKAGEIPSSFKRVAVPILVALVVGLAGLGVVPWLGSIRQALLGHAVTVSGLVFTIPSGYYGGTVDAGALSMWKHGFGFPLWHSSSAFLTVFEHSGQPPLLAARDLDRIRAVEVEEGRRSGMELRSERTVKTEAEQSATCFEFGADRDTRIVCYVFAITTLTVRYEGDTRFSNDLYHFLTTSRSAEGVPARKPQ